MHWNVFIEDFNLRKIVYYDVLAGDWVREHLAKILERSKGDKQHFASELMKMMRWQYWSRCEYEIVLTCWPPVSTPDAFKDRKIDVFEQLWINWDQFVDYVWAHRAEFAPNENAVQDAEELDKMFSNGVDLLLEVE